jgi:hypothetical protein
MLTENVIIEAALFVFGIFGWFLKYWNSKQEEAIKTLNKQYSDTETSLKTVQLALAAMTLQQDQIKILFVRHDENAAGLVKLELAIAEGHYKKGELDAKFNQLDQTIRTANSDLIRKIDEISNKFYEGAHCNKAMDCK